MPKLKLQITCMENKLAHQTFKDYSILLGARIFFLLTDAHMPLLDTHFCQFGIKYHHSM